MVVITVLAIPACSHRDAGDRVAAAAAPATEVDAPQDARTPLDAAIAAHWREAGVAPVAVADDLVLLRRASLDLLGRVPTVVELDGFAADTADDRYERAIDRMLASDEHARHLAATWSEVLLDGAIDVPPRVLLGTQAYLHSRFADDVGLHVVATEMLTASGELGEDSAAGFLFAHGRRGRTTALAGETARVFLAAQIQCAQCHDHPSAAFRQEEFHAFAAHFARTGIRPVRDGEDARVRIVDRFRGEQRLPRPEDPPDEPSGAIVAPAYFGAPTAVGDGTRREALAEAITGDRRFALAIANRTWAQMFGRGVVDPVDDIGLGAPVPALLDVLADTLVEGDFAIDLLLRAIACSTAYRLDSRGEPDDPRRVAAFAQAAVRPLPIEPLLRSLATAGAQDDGTVQRVLERRRGALKGLRFAFDDDEGKHADDGPSLQQAILWLRSDLTAMVARDAPGRALAGILRDEADPGARVEALWWRFYGREPGAAERELVLSHLRARRDEAEAYEDLVHAIVTSSEFTTNH